MKYKNSGVAPANQTKERAKMKSSWISPFLWILVFFLRKTSTIHIEFCSGMPLRKVHELTFLWFGLPGPLLKNVRISGTEKRLGLPSLQKCVCDNFGEIWFGIWFEIWNLWWKKSGEIFGEDFSTCQESTNIFGENFRAKFGANSGDNFGHFVF